MTPIDESGSGDIFVHHSELICSDDQFRYLVQGEYIEFIVSSTDDSRTTASDVTGIRRGPLMCETRHERAKEGELNQGGEGHGNVRRYRGGGPRGVHSGNKNGKRPQLVAPSESI